MIGIIVMLALAHIWAYAADWRPSNEHFSVLFVVIVVAALFAITQVVGGGEGPPGSNP